MTDNLKSAIMERLGSPRGISGSSVDTAEDDEFLCWGFVRGNRRAFNIEFRRLQGAWPALEYAWLHYVAWCPVEAPFMPGIMAPAGSLILHYTNGYRVLIRGRNLRPVHQKLLEHQVKYLAEADRAGDHLSGDDACIVTRIDVIEPPARDAAND